MDQPPRGQPDLLALVARHATSEGRTDSPYPGLWFWRADRPFSGRKSQALTLSLLVVVQGRKTANFGAQALTYDPLHYLLLTGEGEFESAVIEADPERPYLSLSVAMPPDVVARTLIALADSEVGGGDEPAPAYVSRLDAPIVGALCRLLEAVGDPAERTVLAPLIVEEIVFRLLRSEAAAVLRRAVRRGDEARIQESMAFIRAHASDRLTVEELARRAAMSPSHFAHRFRAVARVSPMRYVKHVRLHEARALLLRGARAGEAADQVGYASASHFTRDFKSYFGVPPAEYARRLHAAPGQPA
ncbi:AraC family transcriptional regulator [Nannocystis bainbridge]|uniref:AraC family transcriptional regulator n=1 Tax=Nannocystis bainbridge TaxID=2995303 RepID=A0ABT5DZ48_9BACT|nr:AraC family transcriptional regulator [Nannocystis bainbridge]MDC0718901.1 AraC family transcriptional regulator [Nannocystis bainbridge]